MTAFCPMNLRYFPMDTQMCKLDLSSYGYSEKDVVYLWKNVTLSHKKQNFHIPEFEFIGGHFYNISKEGSTGMNKFSKNFILLYYKLLNNTTRIFFTPDRGNVLPEAYGLLFQPDLRAGRSHSDHIMG